MIESGVNSFVWAVIVGEIGSVRSSSLSDEIDAAASSLTLNNAAALSEISCPAHAYR